jgi:amino acid transporter
MARRDLIVAIILTLVGILAFALIPSQANFRAQKEGYFINVNPQTFPYIMAGIMTAMGVFNIVAAVRKYGKSKKAEESKPEFKLKTVLPLCVLMFFYVIVLPVLGYIISTMILCVLIALYFQAKWWHAILAGLILPVVIYFIFTRIGVPLPRGILYFF